MRRILVTSALPYANGHIHIGHLVEYLQTDIWVRFQKLRGERAVYICADDTHGTAIMIRARQEGRSCEDVIADMSEAHQRDFADFGIEFDHYGSTNSDANREVCGEIWGAFRREGLVSEKEVEQLFDPEAGTFLADRFVRGECPKCGAADQYGDSCDKCGATYSPADLKNPTSTLSGATPELRSAAHLFVDIEKLHGFLDEWTQNDDHLQPEIANYLKGHFLSGPLRPWDISRPAPYFGFEIPDSPGNYWYVWFDAPIGYVSSTREWCARTGEDFETWWRDGTAEVRHFIGKDIVYFHTLFWPAMLKTAGYNLPRRVQVHGFLTVNGEKMSKSKGTFVLARTYLDHLDPIYLRYYYATKLGTTQDDLDLNLEEFIAKNNADLVGKVVNLASRTARFLKGKSLAATYPEDEGLFAHAAAEGDAIAAAYEACDFNQATRRIMALADRANEFVERAEPWKLKGPDQADALRNVCTIALNLFRQIAVYLTPVLPRLAEQTGALLGKPIASWDEVKEPLLGAEVAKFKAMLQRVDPEKVTAMVASSADGDGKAGAPQTDEAAGDPKGDAASDAPGRPVLEGEELAAECTIDDFVKVDLRVARVVTAEEVPDARKLLKVTLSLGGEPEVTRTVFAGIKKAYEAEKLIGRLVVVVANLKPRKMKFGVSEGMIIASGPGGEDVFILSPDDGAKAGQRVH